MFIIPLTLFAVTGKHGFLVTSIPFRSPIRNFALNYGFPLIWVRILGNFVVPLIFSFLLGVLVNFLIVLNEGTKLSTKFLGYLLVIFGMFQIFVSISVLYYMVPMFNVLFPAESVHQNIIILYILFIIMILLGLVDVLFGFEIVIDIKKIQKKYDKASIYIFALTFAYFFVVLSYVLTRFAILSHIF